MQASDQGPQGPKQRPLRGRLLQMAGCVIAFVIVIVGAQIHEALPRNTSRPIALLILGLAFSVLVFFWKWGKQHLVLLAQEVVANDDRPPIVYLRSFADDDQVAADEEALAAIMDEAGPFVAVGRPGDALPPLGASRFYLPGKDWQRFVSQLLDDAALVLIMAGRTEGLGWEIRRCYEGVDPYCLFVLVPDDRDLYQAFRTQVHTQSGMRLPEFPSDKHYRAGSFSGLIRFDADWRGHWILFEKATFRGANAKVAHRNTRRHARLRLALHQACQRAGLEIAAPLFNITHAAVLFVIGFSLIMLAILLGMQITGAL